MARESGIRSNKNLLVYFTLRMVPAFGVKAGIFHPESAGFSTRKVPFFNAKNGTFQNERYGLSHHLSELRLGSRRLSALHLTLSALDGFLEDTRIGFHGLNALQVST